MAGIELKIDDINNGQKVKDVLKGKVGVSSRLFTRLKKNNSIYLNDNPIRGHNLVKTGDILKVVFDYESNTYEPENVNLDVLYEDEHILVVNKDPFTVVHPTMGNPSGTLMNHVSGMLHERGDDFKIRFVNRLDRDTSGCVVIAKNQFIHHMLSEQMKRGEVEKRYVAAVHGRLSSSNGMIDAPIARLSDEDIRREVHKSGKPSRTNYKVITSNEDYSLLDIELLTGRTHQIRVHLKYIGHEIVGDTLYGREEDIISRQFLHSYRIKFTHPISGETIDVIAPLKPDLELAISEMGLIFTPFDV